MAKRVDSFTLPMPLKQAVQACRAAMAAGGWTLIDDSGHGFFVKERFDLWSCLFCLQSKHAIFPRKGNPKRRIAGLHGSLHSVTPLRTSRLRKLRASLQGRTAAYCPSAAESRSKQHPSESA